MVPYEESLIENSLCLYSIYCSVEKYLPKAQVSAIPISLFFIALFSMQWCAQVTLTPEEISTRVLRSGTLVGSNLLIPVGGHLCPISNVGLTAI